MRAGRRGFVLFNTLFVLVYLGCGDRGTGAVPSADSVPAAGPADATPPSTASATPDTTAAAARDTAPAAPKPAASSAPATRRAAAKPAAPAPRPAAPAPAPADTPDVVSSAPAADTTPAPTPETATAPLRDEYHRAPLDTVSQQVYDGWKQYNLNCARCHGEDVLGSTIAPHLVVSLRPNGPINTKELFVQTVCAGRPEKGMPAWCPLGLEMDKIEAMYAYVKGRSEGKIRPGRPAVNPEG